jgi:ElaB protein
MSDLNGVPEHSASLRSDAGQVRSKADMSAAGRDGASVGAKLTLLGGKLVEAQSIAREKYRAAYETTDDYVHAKPWQVIAMAVMGGLVVGMLAAR